MPALLSAESPRCDVISGGERPGYEIRPTDRSNDFELFRRRDLVG